MWFAFQFIMARVPCALCGPLLDRPSSELVTDARLLWDAPYATERSVLARKVWLIFARCGGSLRYADRPSPEQCRQTLVRIEERA